MKQQSEQTAAANKENKGISGVANEDWKKMCNIADNVWSLCNVATVSRCFATPRIVQVTNGEWRPSRRLRQDRLIVLVGR